MSIKIKISKINNEQKQILNKKELEKLDNELDELLNKILK